MRNKEVGKSLKEILRNAGNKTAGRLFNNGSVRIGQIILDLQENNLETEQKEKNVALAKERERLTLNNRMQRTAFLPVASNWIK